MKLALCNEVLRDLSFAEQCRVAAALGYDALEVAPFTLCDDPTRLEDGELEVAKETAGGHGLSICGLHWLLLKPEGLSLNGPDAEARQRTIEVIRSLVQLCVRFGGSYLVHGSPAQRSVPANGDLAQAEHYALEAFRAIAEDVEKAGVTYCVEPLGRRETNFINTIEQAAAFVEKIGSPGFKTMIDARAALENETLDLPELIEQWVPTGMIGHIQLNDPNRRGPGQGDHQFAPTIQALIRTGYQGVIAMEPFDYQPDGPTTAAFSLGYVKGLIEAARLA